MFRDNWDSIEDFKNGNIQSMLEGQYWNYKSEIHSERANHHCARQDKPE